MAPIIAAVQFTDQQVVTAIIALYGMAVAVATTIVRYLREEIVRLNRKIEVLEHSQAALNAESRQMAKAALEALEGMEKRMERKA